MDVDKSIIEGFYSNYMSRELAALLGGGIFIEIVYYSLNNTLLIFTISWEESFTLIGFLAISYLIGFIFDRLGNNFINIFYPINLPNPKSKDRKKEYKSGFVLQRDLKENYDEKIMGQLERQTTLWILGQSVGSSAIIGGILMIGIKYFSIEKLIISRPWILASLLILVGCCMLRLARDAKKKHNSENQELIDNFKEHEYY